MLNRNTISILALGALLFTGCGSSSSSKKDNEPTTAETIEKKALTAALDKSQEYWDSIKIEEDVVSEKDENKVFFYSYTTKVDVDGKNGKYVVGFIRNKPACRSLWTEEAEGKYKLEWLREKDIDKDIAEIHKARTLDQRITICKEKVNSGKVNSKSEFKLSKEGLLLSCGKAEVVGTAPIDKLALNKLACMQGM